MYVGKVDRRTAVKKTAENNLLKAEKKSFSLSKKRKPSYFYLPFFFWSGEILETIHVRLFLALRPFLLLLLLLLLLFRLADSACSCSRLLTWNGDVGEKKRAFKKGNTSHPTFPGPQVGNDSFVLHLVLSQLSPKNFFPLVCVYRHAFPFLTFFSW